MSSSKDSKEKSSLTRRFKDRLSKEWKTAYDNRPHYTYKPISYDSIRVLEVSTVPFTKHRLYRLRPRRWFKNDIPFISMSYCWEGQLPDQPISCDGKILLVTANVKKILENLDNPTGVMYLWIDAVCINQADLEEKSHQISMMAGIYRLSARTVVWLGDGNQAVDYAIQTILAIFKDCERNVDAIAEKMVKMYDDEMFWSGVNNLLERPWFTRLWIMQEAVLPQRVEMQCGHNHFLAPDLVLFFKSIAVDSQNVQVNGLRNRLDAIMLSEKAQVAKRSWVQIIECRRYMSRDGHILLSRLLIHVKNQQVTDERDRIYGVLGLVSPKLRDIIKVDYGISLPLVVVRCFRACLMDTSDAGLLGSLSGLCQGLPSWCDSQSIVNYTPLLWMEEADHTREAVEEFSGPSALVAKDCSENILRSIREAIFAHGRFNSVAPEVVEECILPLQGFEFDVIDEIVRLPWGTKNGFANSISESFKYADVLKKCLGLSQRFYNDADTAAAAVFRVLTFWNKTKPEKFPPECHAATMNSVTQFCASTKLKRGTELYEESDDISKEEQAVGFKGFSRMINANYGRCFFTTKGGRLGLGSIKMRSGDCICMLNTVRMPYIIRYTGIDEYSSFLLGPAYVEGFVHGEALELEDAKKVKVFYAV